MQQLAVRCRQAAGYSLERYPDVEIEISISNRMIDVIDSGFDAGIRYGGTVPEDMVAQRLSTSRRQMPAALRLFIELVRELRPMGLQSARCSGSRQR